LLILIIFISLCCIWCLQRISDKNPVYVNSKPKKNVIEDSRILNLFQSGIWSSRYYQYNTWHGPAQFSLFFDPLSTNITGSGTDDVGTFTIDGTYSTESHRIGLTKKYKLGTGNQKENLGHEVTIQLTWNSHNNQFEGKWYVQTSKYNGEDKFELKLIRQQQELPANEKI